MSKVRSASTYECRRDPRGWRCGKCLRGQLGPNPKNDQKCRVCGAKVWRIEGAQELCVPWSVAVRHGATT